MAHLENTIEKLLTERLAANLEKAGITDNGAPLSGLGARKKAPAKMTKSKILKAHQAAIRDAAIAMAASVRAQTEDVKARVATDIKMRLTEVPPGLRRELIPAVKLREEGAWLARNTAFLTRPELDWTDLRPGTRTAEALPNIHLTEDVARRGAREAAKVVAEGGSPTQARERLRLLGIKPARKGRPPTTAGERAFPFVWDALPKIAHMAGLGQDLDKGAQAFDGYDLDEGAQAFSGYDIVKGAQAFGWLGQDIETGAQAFGQVWRRRLRRFFPRISRIRAARVAMKKISEARRKRRPISIPKATAEALRVEATREALRTEPIVEPRIEPITEFRTEPIVEPRIEPITEFRTEPIVEPIPITLAPIEEKLARFSREEAILVLKRELVQLREKEAALVVRPRFENELYVTRAKIKIVEQLLEKTLLQPAVPISGFGQDIETGAQAFGAHDLDTGAQAFSGVGQAGAEQDPWIEW